MTDDKRGVREVARRRRAALTEAERRAASAAITEFVRNLSAWRAARCVALFASLPEEVDTSLLIEAARAEGRRVALPAVVGRDAPLVFRDATDPRTPLAPSRRGILEPGGEAATVSLDAIGLFVVPGLAFDRAGRRLGYGAGFYDRTLAGLATPRVMVAYAVQEVPTVPWDPHDAPMNAVITEHGLVAP